MSAHEPITPAARQAVENLLEVAPINWTEQDARETISHLGYYEMAEEGSLRRILSLPERDRLRSARTYMAGLDAGGESGIRFLLDGLGVESIHQLGRICRAAAETALAYRTLPEDALDEALDALDAACRGEEVPAFGGAWWRVNVPAPREVLDAYLAGIVDGEGTILWHQRTVVLRVSNTDRPLIDWLAVLGGSVHLERRTPTEALRARKDLWRWTITGWRAVELLERMLPYLIVKRVRAEFALARWNER